MRIITIGILLAATCQAQIAFVPAYPGNSTPTKPIFGVLNRVTGDTIQQRSIKNLGSAPIIIQAMSLEIKSPGLEGEWWDNLSVSGMETATLMVQRSQFQKFEYSQLYAPAIAPQATARLFVSRLTDCNFPCTIDETVKPPDTLYKHNTANPVDTIEARVGVYWRVQNTNTYDSAYLDCQIEYRIGTHSEGVHYRGNLLGSARPVGVAGGWRVESGAWSLRRPNGTDVPLERQATTQGLVVQPTSDFKGIGILHNANGQAFRVVGVR